MNELKEVFFVLWMSDRYRHLPIHGGIGCVEGAHHLVGVEFSFEGSTQDLKFICRICQVIGIADRKLQNPGQMPDDILS